MNAVIKSKCRDSFADSMATKTQFVGTGKNCQCASSYLNAQSKTFLSENKYTSLVGIYAVTVIIQIADVIDCLMNL